MSMNFCVPVGRQHIDIRFLTKVSGVCQDGRFADVDIVVGYPRDSRHCIIHDPEGRLENDAVQQERIVRMIGVKDDASGNIVLALTDVVVGNRWVSLRNDQSLLGAHH